MHGLRFLSKEEFDAIDKATRDAFASNRIHHPTIRANNTTSSPGKAVSPIVVGASVIGLQFTVNIDDAAVLFKVDDTYVANPTFSVHWTKSTDTDDSGKTVLWRITYTVFNGISDEITAATDTLELEGTYIDPGTTTRIVYETAELPLLSFNPAYYVGAKIEAITPGSGTPLSEPVLVNLDLNYDKFYHEQ